MNKPTDDHQADNSRPDAPVADAASSMTTAPSPAPDAAFQAGGAPLPHHAQPPQPMPHQYYHGPQPQPPFQGEQTAAPYGMYPPPFPQPEAGSGFPGQPSAAPAAYPPQPAPQQRAAPQQPYPQQPYSPYPQQPWQPPYPQQVPYPQQPYPQQPYPAAAPSLGAAVGVPAAEAERQSGGTPAAPPPPSSAYHAAPGISGAPGGQEQEARQERRIPYWAQSAPSEGTPSAPFDGQQASSWTPPKPPQTRGQQAPSWTPPGSPQAGKPQPPKAPPKPPKPKPSYPPFSKTHPVLTASSPLPGSIGSGLFGALAALPIVPLTLMFLLMTIFSLDPRDLWYSDEIRHADAFENLLRQGHWLILHMNGEVYPDKPPLYFLFLRGLYELLRTDGPMLHFAAAAVSGLLYLWAALGLGRLAARVDGRTNFAAGIVLLTTGYIIGVLHYGRMDLLFSACILASCTALYRGAVSPGSAFGATIAGFVLAGAAVLIKGPLGIAIPFVSLLFFVLWRGSPLRLLRLDFLVGIVAFCAVIGGYVGLIYMQQRNFDFLLGMMQKQVVQRALDTFHHKEPWYYYLTRLPLFLLPWVIIVFFLPWKNLFGKNMREGIALSRKPEGEGIAFLWCMILPNLVLLSALSGKILIYLLPLLPPMALLIARAILRLTDWRAKGFRLAMATVLGLFGMAVIVGALMLFDFLPMPDISGLPVWKLPLNSSFFLVSAIVILMAAIIGFCLRSPRPEGTLLVVALTGVCLNFPLANMVAPSFNAVLSPKAQAEVLRAYAQKGYTPVTHNIYSGTYSYYSGYPTKDYKDEKELAALAGPDKKVIIAMRAKDAQKWTDKPACLTEVHRQWIETREYVLLACPAIEGLAPVVRIFDKGLDPVGEAMRLMGVKWPLFELPKPAAESLKPAAKPTPPPATPAEPAKPTEAPAVPAEPAKPTAAPAAPVESAEPAETQATPVEPAKPAEEPAAEPQATPSQAPQDAPKKPEETSPETKPASPEAPEEKPFEDQPVPIAPAAPSSTGDGRASGGESSSPPAAKPAE